MTERTALRDRWRDGRRERTEEGFTLLELVAALTILAVGIVGVIGVTNSSIEVASTTSARSKAVALATHRMEALRATPYDQLEVKPSCTPQQTANCYPNETTTVGGRTYLVEAGVTMANAGLLRDAYKAAYVIASWTDRTYHEVRQETIVYPGGRGPYVPVTTSTTAPPQGVPDPPTELAAVNTPISGLIGMDLTWTPPASSTPAVDAYAVEYSTDSFATAPFVLTTTTTTPYLRVTDLAAGTTYQFRVFSVAANGSRSAAPSNVVEETTSADLLSLCRVGVVSVSPSAAFKAGGPIGAKLKTGNPVVAVSTTGNCMLTTLTASYSPNAETTLQAALTRNGNVYSGLIDGSQSWDVGRHEIVVRDATNAERGSTYLLVCQSSKKVCR